MKIQVHQIESLIYAQIDGMYCADEINAITKELVFLETLKQEPTETSSAVQDGKILKSGKGIFVDHVYLNRCYSTILNLNRRLFDQNIVNQLKNQSCIYGHLEKCDHDTTLVNFYNNGEEYKTHSDGATLTALTFFSIGKFSGGSFCFPGFDVSVQPVPGRTIIFPGCAPHRADPTFAEPGNYRVTMAQFVNYK